MIGPNRATKGKSFEELIKAMLGNQGYTDFRLNIHAIGMEFDLKATHKTDLHKVLCECKAHAKPVATPDLTDFNGKFRNQLDKRKIHKSMFISISDFTGTAREWYNDEVHSKIKKVFKLYGPEELTKLLVDSLYCYLMLN
ncbi:MAG TPA: restriction endonuclease [Nitrososphaeraceae archaeon]